MHYICKMKYEIHQCIGSKLRRMSRIADSYFRKHLSGFGITETQMTVLFVLSALGEVEQGKIGQVLVLERSSVSRSVRLLEKEKLVVRTDKYRPEIELTKKGKEMVKSLIPLWEKSMDELTQKLGDDGLEHIKELEKKIS